MTRFTHELTLNNTIDEVFSFISNPVNNPVWDTSILETALDVDEEIAVGTTGKSVSTFLGKTYDTNYTYEDFQPPRMVSHRTTANSVEVAMKSGLKTARRGRSTQLKLDINVRFKGRRRLLEPILARKIRGRIAANLDALQVYLRFKSLKRF